MDWGPAPRVPPRHAGRNTRDGDAPGRSRPAPKGTVMGRTRRASGVGSSNTPTGSVARPPKRWPGACSALRRTCRQNRRRGPSTRLNERCDVFGLGAVLCGDLDWAKDPRTPAGTRNQIYRKGGMTANQADARARLAACGAEPELVALCLRCLAPEPDDRPHDAGEVAAAVAALRAAAEDRARRAELDGVRAVEQSKRRRVQAALVAAVGLLACGGIGVAGWQEQQATALRAQLTRPADALDDLAGRV